MKTYFKTSLIIITSYLFYFESRAQESDYFEYQNEILWGINKNTNGGLIGGINLKFGNKIKDNKYRIYGIEIVNVKHPKEYKYTSPFGGDNFIWAKQNTMYSLRMQYGIEKSIFNKKDENGIQINAHLSGGPGLGVLVPYYIRYNRNNAVVIEAFDSNIHNFNNVIGTAGFLEGINEAKIRPGINLKSAINFEFGSMKKGSIALEVGFLAEAFTKKMIIMPTVKNKLIFTSAFITLFYGRKWK
tara:strand:+ start:1061 stop:1789 length:729 start_codon:yes stop_codon:yes gene_type:complete